MHARTLFLCRSILIFAVLFGLTGSTVMAMPPSRAADSSELLPNGDFSAGARGWRMNGNDASLRLLDEQVAELSSNGRGNATLNDAPNTVQATTRGTSYVATARVRTTTPNVTGALRIREVGPDDVTAHQTSFHLRDTRWQTITLTITTTYRRAHLDLNLTAWNLPAHRTLQVDWVSLRETDTQTAPAVPPASVCDAPTPSGTLFGSSVWTVNQTLAQSLADVDEGFGQPPVIRHFSSGLPFTWDSRQAEVLQDRSLVLSFKAHPRQVTSGSLDGFFREWFATAPADQTIYWSYFHEPENNINAGEFTAAEYRAAWQHLAELADDACRPTMFATLILTAWTVGPQSGRDYRIYDAGPDVVDVIAFDPYNGVWDPQRGYYESPEQMLGDIVRTMEGDGRPWGIAEIGSRISAGDDGTGRADWLRAIARYSEDHGALFVTYFHSVGNADWRLRDAVSRDAWASVVGG